MSEHIQVLYQKTAKNIEGIKKKIALIVDILNKAGKTNIVPNFILIGFGLFYSFSPALEETPEVSSEETPEGILEEIQETESDNNQELMESKVQNLPKGPSDFICKTVLENCLQFNKYWDDIDNQKDEALIELINNHLAGRNFAKKFFNKIDICDEIIGLVEDWDPNSKKQIFMGLKATVSLAIKYAFVIQEPLSVDENGNYIFKYNYYPDIDISQEIKQRKITNLPEII